MRDTAAPISGIYAMQFAYFDAHGAIDPVAMRRQADGCIRNGADGIAVLGLGTEVNKLSLAERLKVLEIVAEEVGARVPLSVTIAEPNVPAQVEFARAARSVGASWLVLQPPPVRTASEAELIRFFGAVADATDLPIGIQNAPEYLGFGLSSEGIATLARNHGNFRLVKGEGPVLGIRRLIELTEGQVAVFNGRGGLELIDNLRAGCAGMVPGAESCDLQARIFRLMRQGTPEAEAEAGALYRRLLPLVVFLMQSIDNFLCYGKRLAAARYGIGTVHDRVPAYQPTAFGLSCLKQATQWLELDETPVL